MTVTLSGDTLLLVQLEQTIDPLVNARVIALARRLQARLTHGVRDIVPSYCAVGIHFDPLATDLAALARVVEEEWRQVDRDHVPLPGSVLEIEVRYGGEDGPDLEAVGQWAGCSPASVIEQHASGTYRVYMLGFVPGFCYMGRVDRRIAAPRRSVPRDRVPAGSVGIAGEQTGIYPIASPGGWQLIGRTSTVMFDPSRDDPSLLHPGDLVRFKPV